MYTSHRTTIAFQHSFKVCFFLFSLINIAYPLFLMRSRQGNKVLFLHFHLTKALYLPYFMLFRKLFDVLFPPINRRPLGKMPREIIKVYSAVFFIDIPSFFPRVRFPLYHSFIGCSAVKSMTKKILNRLHNLHISVLLWLPKG